MDSKEKNPSLIRRPNRSGFPTSIKPVPGREALEREIVELKEKLQKADKAMVRSRNFQINLRERLAMLNFELDFCKQTLDEYRACGRGHPDEVCLENHEGWQMVKRIPRERWEGGWYELACVAKRDLSINEMVSSQDIGIAKKRAFRCFGRTDDAGRPLLEEVTEGGPTRPEPKASEIRVPHRDNHYADAMQYASHSKYDSHGNGGIGPNIAYGLKNRAEVSAQEGSDFAAMMEYHRRVVEQTMTITPEGFGAPLEGH